MKALLSLIISGALVVSGYSQTRNVLVGTNNAVVQPTNFWSVDASNARTGLGLGSAATNPASAFQPASSALTNLVSGNGGSLTNLQATNLVGLIPTSNIPPIVLTNIGTITIQQGGTGATNAANARQNLGSTTVGDAVFIATNAAAARTVLGALSTSGDAINLTNFPTLLLRTNGNGAGLTNLTAANITGTVALASNVTGTIAISNGGSGATTAGGARTNLGLGATWLTNTTASDFLSAVGLGSTNSAQFGGLAVGGNLAVVTNQIDFGSPVFFADRSGTNAVFLFEEASDAAIARTNLGLGWPALTNTNSGTGLVSVNTNGEVVSPTNFWQEAPITTTFIESQPTTNSSTNISPSRLLHIHSLATNIVNTTNTIILPTNALTFEGDIALVVHKGPTNSLTQVRQVGSTNNLITLNKFNEAVEFTYYNNTWQFLETAAFTAPIYFSGTNAAANASASRTNLGLGNNSTPEFTSLILSALANTNSVDYAVFVDDIGAFYSTSVGAARTNLGLGATNNVTFSNVTASGTLTATSTVTAKTNLVVEGFVDYTAARTNNTPTNTPNFAAHAAWIEVKIGTNSFFLPAYQ